MEVANAHGPDRSLSELDVCFEVGINSDAPSYYELSSYLVGGERSQLRRLGHAERDDGGRSPWRVHNRAGDRVGRSIMKEALKARCKSSTRQDCHTENVRIANHVGNEFKSRTIDSTVLAFDDF